ncbi:helix-turn-helix domain-containing protein [Planotetraspora thailandica]|nr:helix-turn-helix domain-containing protein [Planotetraspora thailandica]
MSETWTIGELAERAAGLLGSQPPVNGRVRDVPNERLIRWYATIGLLDPPLTRRGRIAQYGRRHLLQLVAVKRLQAEGLSIAEIQVRLAGATDAILQHAARIPDVPDAVSPAGAPPREPRRERFWTRSASVISLDSDPMASPPAAALNPHLDALPPNAADTNTAPAASAVPHAKTADTTTERDASGTTAPGDRIAPADVVYGVRLAPGVTVSLSHAGRTVTPAEVQALRAAAEPLLSMLAQFGLADRPDHEGMTS